MADNIADIPIVEENPVSTDDNYMNLFTEIGDRNDELSVLITNLEKQPHDQARVELLRRIVQKQQKQNEQMYDLLVEMNNIFGTK